MPESITLHGGLIRRDGDENADVLSVEEIHRAVFGEEDSPFADALRALPLRYEEFPGSLVASLESGAEDGRPFIALEPAAVVGQTIARLTSTKEGYPDYGIADGLWIPLPPGAVEALREELATRGITLGSRISMDEYARLRNMTLESAGVVDRVSVKFSSDIPLDALAVPGAFNGTLYPYQETGFRWLAGMAGLGASGCLLADEMGLGKTPQVIALLLHLKKEGKRNALVICPSSLLTNWQREIGRFAPDLTVLLHRGNLRTGVKSGLENAEVILTSYDTLLSDRNLFKSLTWDTIIIDEAQSIRNPDARRTVALKEVPRRFAVAVTGTPLENRLTDIWSISDFMVPGLLGERSEFERQHPETVISGVAIEPMISPFMLRRTVDTVAKDLPPRIDIPVAMELGLEASQQYEEIREAALREFEKGAGLAALQRLRMYCCHPRLCDREAPADFPKLSRLHEILEEIFAAGEKVLIFTSFHEAADIIAKEITEGHDVWTRKIDGRLGPEARQGEIDAFSARKGAAALVLNPKAAGAGLNIVAANHVIHYNLEWNPAVEDQASARAYRRGQDRPVTIHRLFYINTVEQAVDEKTLHKRSLFDAAVQASPGQVTDSSAILNALRMSPAGKSS